MSQKPNCKEFEKRIQDLENEVSRLTKREQLILSLTFNLPKPMRSLQMPIEAGFNLL
jgi:hypothetical protein